VNGRHSQWNHRPEFWHLSSASPSTTENAFASAHQAPATAIDHRHRPRPRDRRQQWVTASANGQRPNHGQQFKSRFMRTSAPTPRGSRILGPDDPGSAGLRQEDGQGVREKVFDVIDGARSRASAGIAPAARITALGERSLRRYGLPDTMVGTHARRIFKTTARFPAVMTENPSSPRYPHRLQARTRSR